MENVSIKLNTITLEKILAVYSGAEADLKSRQTISVTSYLQNLEISLDYLFNYAVLKGEYYAKNAIAITEEIEIVENKFLTFLKSSSFNDLVEEKIKTIADSVASDPSLNIQIATIRGIIISPKVTAKFIESRETYSDHFYWLSRFVDNRLNGHARLIDHRLNVELNRHLNDYVESNYSEEKVNAYIYALNVKLAQLDEGMVASQEILSYLISHLMLLEDIVASEKNRITDDDVIYKYLRYKCRFLTLKVLRRLKKPLQFEAPFIKGKRIKESTTGPEIKEKIKDATGNFITINVATLERGISVFSSFDEDIKSHYPSSLSSATFAKSLNDLEVFCDGLIDAAKKSNISVKEVHKLCKYIKYSVEIICSDDRFRGSGQNKIEICLYTLLAYYKSVSRSSYDEYSCASAIGLIHNSIFLLKCGIEINTLDKIENVADVAKHISDQYDKASIDVDSKIRPNVQLDTYFFTSVRQFLERILTIDKKSLKKKQLEEYRREFRGLIAKVNEVYRQSLDRIAYSKQESIFPIYIEINNCFKESIGNEFKCYDVTGKLERTSDNKIVTEKGILFLDSSYILPSDYSALQFADEKEIYTIRSLEATAYHQISNDSLFDAIETNEAAFEDKQKATQMNAMQMIALFSGVFSFILGSAVVIPKLPHEGMVFAFMFVMAVVVLMFVFALRLVLVLGELFPYRQSKEKYFNWPTFGGYVFLMACFFVLLHYAHTRIERFNNERILQSEIFYLREKFYIDSVEHVILNSADMQQNKVRTETLEARRPALDSVRYELEKIRAQD